MAAPRLHASPEEEAAIEQMKREMEKPDIWANEVVGTGVKVALVALSVAVVVSLLDVATPIIDATVSAFPNGSAQ